MAKPEIYALGRLIADIYANEVNVPLRSVSSFNRYLGGSAANTAVGMARHGARVGLISRVGKDQHGDFLLDVLKREGIDTGMVRVDDSHQTGLAFAALRPPSDSELLFYCKSCAYEHLALHDLDATAIETAKILVVGASTLSGSPSREATFKALQLNRSTGGTNVIDVDWRPMFWQDKTEAEMYYKMAVGMADVIIANEPELEFIGGSADPFEASRTVLTMGPSQIVAKRGAQGVLYFGPEGQREAPAFRVNVLNTLGAGDGFGAAYTFGLLQGWPIERRLTYASAAGAIVVSRHSCSEAMPTAQETEAFIAQHRSDEQNG